MEISSMNVCMQVAVNLAQYRDIERNFDEGCRSNIYKNHNATTDESLDR